MSTIRLALFGQPVSHSPSPHVHRAFAAQFGLDVDYRLIETAPEAFAGALDAFRAGGGSGCNITLPLKHLASKIADTRSARVSLAGAANTLSWTAEGQCRADNTDGEGLVRDLEDNLGISVVSGRVLLLGAGGAAAGILAALLEREPMEVVICNRTLERAESLAERHESLGRIRCIALEDTAACGAVDIVIDATSMGRSGALPDLPPEVLAEAQVCYSLNYGRVAGPMRTLAVRAGVPFHDGLGMLVEQAACSFEIWTGHRPKTAQVLEDLARTMR